MNWLPVSVLVGIVTFPLSPSFAAGTVGNGKAVEPCGFVGSAFSAAVAAECVPTYPRPAAGTAPARWGEGIPNAAPTGGSSLTSPRYASPFTAVGYTAKEEVGALPPPAGKIFNKGARVGNYLYLPYSCMYWPNRQNSQLEVIGAYQPGNKDVLENVGEELSDKFSTRNVMSANAQVPPDDPSFLAITKVLEEAVADVGTRGKNITVGEEIIIDDQSSDMEFLPTPASWTDSLDTPASFRGSSKLAKLSNEEQCEAVCYATIPESGVYEVQMWWVPGPPKYRSANVPVTVHAIAGDVTKVIDQTNPALRKQWNSLGRFVFTKGDRKKVLTLSTKGMPSSPTETVSLDSVRIVKVQD